MNKLSYNGGWWVPGGDIKLPGRLLFKDKKKKILLEIFGDKYIDGAPVINSSEGRDPRYHSKNYNDDFKELHLLVNGKTISDITLYNVRWAGTEDIGEDIYLIKYEVQFAFFGIYAAIVKDLLVQSATVIFPYMSSWFDGGESLNKLREIDKISFSEYGYSLNKSRVAPIKVKKGLHLVIFDQYERGREVWGVERSVKFQKVLSFEYDKGVPFSELLSDIGVFGRLLEFCHGKPINKKLITVGFDKMTRVGNYTLEKGDEVEKHAQHQNYMLLSRWIMNGNELDSVIQHWFTNTSWYGIYDIYCDSNNWFQNSNAMLTNVMFNNRFLNVVQALESYCRKNIAKRNSENEKIEDRKKEFEENKKVVLLLIKDKKQKEWCNANLNFVEKQNERISLEKMLKGLIEANKDILAPLFGHSQVIDFFPRFASRVRNRLSHGVQEKTNQGETLHVFFQVGQILLAICILRTLGVRDIEQKIRHYDDFQKIIYLVKRTRLKFI